jgi:mannose-6-phosphate isomerase-like protein (cupin superfamily)
METIRKVNLAEKFSLIHEYRSPKVAGELNGQHVKLVKMKGEFIWHHHDNEDELFLVVKGKFLMELHTGNIEVNDGEIIIISRGVEHRAVAAEEVEIILFEPAGTVNTGNIRNDFTRDIESI